MSEFLLSCESTADIPYSYVEKRNIPILFYKYTVDGQDFDDDMGRDPECLKRFYRLFDEDKTPTTSQINQYTYEEYFRGLLKDSDRVLHICLGTGMTGSYNNARNAAEELSEEFPEKRLVVVDSLCSSTGVGMLLMYAADLRDEGKSLEEVAQWVEEHKRRIHHQFYSVDLKYYRKTGRMSGPAASLAAILDICPIMRINREGRIVAYDKVKGKKKAIARTVKVMGEHAVDGLDYSGKCLVNHSARPEDAVETKEAILKSFPNLKSEDILICDIGTIIASHCGPGTLAVFFLGDERAE